MDSDIAKLLMQIVDKRERAAQAQRLARGLMRAEPAARSLRAYATELEAEAEKLEAQAAVLKQAAHQATQEGDPEQSIAALKPPPVREPDPEPEPEK